MEVDFIYATAIERAPGHKCQDVSVGGFHLRLSKEKEAGYRWDDLFSSRLFLFKAFIPALGATDVE